jgi:hypothetical protein
MRGPGDIRPTHLGWKQVVWNFFLKKYIDGAVVATSNSMIILPLENQWDQFQRYFHLKYHRIILTLKHVRNIVEIQKTAPSSLSCLVSLYIYIGDIVAT